MDIARVRGRQRRNNLNSSPSRYVPKISFAIAVEGLSVCPELGANCPEDSLKKGKRWRILWYPSSALRSFQIDR